MCNKKGVGVFMSANAVNGTETNNYVPRGPSVAGRMVQDAFLGGIGMGVWTLLSSPRVDEFVPKAESILEKDEALNKALKNYDLGNLLELKKEKKLEEALKNEPEVLKGFKSVFSKFKQQSALKQAGIGAVVCGALGLVIGLIFKASEKKAMKKAAQAQQ